MGKLMDSVLRKIRGEREAEKVDMGDLAVLKKSGMTFRLSAFDAGDVRVSNIDMSAMLGLMKMESVIVTASEHDVPLYNYDVVKAMGKKTVLAEFYDTCLNDASGFSEAGMKVKKAFSSLGEYGRGERWYDAILLPCSLAKTDRALNDEKIGEIAERYTDLFLEMYGTSEACSPEEKKKKTAEYVSRLLSEGGASTDQFKKLFGDETTQKVFRKLFGIG